MKTIYLDVREPDEFKAEYVRDSVNVPFSHLLSAAPGVMANLPESELVLLCRGGVRAELARGILGKMGFSDKFKFTVYPGGIEGWKKNGKPLVRRSRLSLPLMRQVQLIAGSVVLVSSLLSATVDARFSWLAAFFGAGLTVAGLTGFCGMAKLLSLMPWNNRDFPQEQDLSCSAPPR